MLIGKLTQANIDKFFDKLYPGAFFEVAQSFSHDDVVSLCAKNGLLVEYCMPGTDAYAKYGSMAYTVVEEDLMDQISDCIRMLNEKPNSEILVKAGRLNGEIFKDASKICIKGSPRKTPCRKKVLNKMIKQKLLVLSGSELKNGNRNYTLKLSEAYNEALF